MSESGYLLNNAAPQAAARFGGLEATFDAVTISHIEAIGLRPGQRSLEVGAGGGSVARWMAGRVGTTGHVLATDLDPRWFQPDDQPQLEVRRHDLVDEPVPDGPWDFVHERLVLVHLPRRIEVLDRLVDALAPGGALLLEDFDTGEVATIDRQGPEHDLVVKFQRAFNDLLRQRGAATDFAAGALRLLKERGLVDTGATGRVVIDVGGSPFAQVLAANAVQLHDALLGVGLTGAEYERFLRCLDDSDVVVRSPTMISTWGRRPE